MAERASVLCPDKKVIVVSPEAGCPMADMITGPALAHPECRAEVLDLADFIGSTSAILAHCKENLAREFIILTE